MSDNMLKWGNIVVTGITLICSVVAGVISAETMKSEVNKEVARQMAEATKESV